MRNILLCFSVWILGLSAYSQPSTSSIDVQHYTFNMQLNDENNNITGEATVAVKFLKNAASFQLDLVKKSSTGKGMLVSAITENGKTVPFAQSDETVKLSAAAKANSVHSYTITYSG